MEAKRTELRNHTRNISVVLREVCDASNVGPLVREDDESGNIFVRPTHWYKPVSRWVTTDLGRRESALRLSIPDGQQPRYWIGLHECWEQKSRIKICFRDCGLRLYVGGEDEEVVQILRLEWVAPTFDRDGEPNYDGKHAGHPHWHIDRSALVGPEEYLRSLESLTAPEPQCGLEDFTQITSPVALGRPRPVHDCSWLQQLHLPAQAGWMRLKWDGRKVPGPHQCEPDSLTQLENWWAGALRYFAAELLGRAG